MTVTRTALVGLGAIAFEHLAKLRRRSDVEIVGICDLHPTLVAAVAERFGGLAGYSEYDRMIEECRPDVVHVLTPPQAHRDVATRALDAGAHVFIEKPITPRWEDYVRVRDLAAGRGLLFCENYNYRFMPGALAAYDMCRCGLLGEVVGVDVRFAGVMSRTGPYGETELVHFAHQLPGGALQNFATHPVSLALPLIGSCERVIGTRRRREPGFASDDELRVIVDGARASAVLNVSSNTTPSNLTMSINGTRASLDVNVYTGQLRIVGDGSVIVQGLRDGLAAIRSSASLFTAALTGRRDPYQGLGTLLDHFYAAIQGRRPAPIDVAEMDAVNGVMRDLFERTSAR